MKILLDQNLLNLIENKYQRCACFIDPVRMTILDQTILSIRSTGFISSSEEADDIIALLMMDDHATEADYEPFRRTIEHDYVPLEAPNEYLSIIQLIERLRLFIAENEYDQQVYTISGIEKRGQGYGC